MRMRGVILAVSGLLAFGASQTAAAGAVPVGWQPEGGVPGNLLMNPGAEDTPDLRGWAVDGFAVATYGSSLGVPPLEYAGPRNLGTRLFAATHGGASMDQSVLVEANTGQPLLLGGWLGRRSSTSDTAVLAVEFRDASDQPLGAPATAEAMPVSPCTEQISGETTQRINLARTPNVPAGARTARVSITAAGTPGSPSTVTAEALYLTTDTSYGAVPSSSCGPPNPPQPPLVSPPPTTPPQQTAPTGATVKNPSALTLARTVKKRLLTVRVATSAGATGKLRLTITATRAGQRLLFSTRTLRLTKARARLSMRLPRRATRIRIVARYSGDNRFLPQTVARVIKR